MWLSLVVLLWFIEQIKALWINGSLVNQWSRHQILWGPSYRFIIHKPFWSRDQCWKCHIKCHYFEGFNEGCYKSWDCNLVTEMLGTCSNGVLDWLVLGDSLFFYKKGQVGMGRVYGPLFKILKKLVEETTLNCCQFFEETHQLFFFETFKNSYSRGYVFSEIFQNLEPKLCRFWKTSETWNQRFFDSEKLWKTLWVEVIRASPSVLSMSLCIINLNV